MPTQGTKKYVVTAHPFAANQSKGMWLWNQTKAATKIDEPEGSQVYVEVGTEVYMTPEAAQPLIEANRLRPATEA